MDKDAKKIVEECEKQVKTQFEQIDDICEYNSEKVLDAFHQQQVSENHFHKTTGYGYDDLGREVIEKVYATIFKAEDALVRNQFISGSHALTVTLFALLRPNDILLSITGKPYDTLDEVIGLVENQSSLKSFGIQYQQIDLIDNEFDYKKIEEVLTKQKIKVIEIQRSKGYSTRKSISITSLEKVIAFIKKIDPNVIIMIDNCYCEFVHKKEPIEIGADIAVGSLIKNLGGGIATNGAYVVGKHELIELVAQRLTLPGEGRDVGPTMGMNREFLQGIYFAPSVVASSLKTAVLTSKVFASVGVSVEPKYDEERADIVQNLIFYDEQKLIQFCTSIQSASAIDAHVTPIPWDMPGYQDKVIMAAGTFTQGSSIELSCDGPIRPPYIAYMQGTLLYPYGKLAVIKALQDYMKKISL